MSLWTLGQCLFGHGERIRERDSDGRLCLVCARCGDAVTVLADLPKGEPIAPLKASKAPWWMDERKVS